MNFTTWRNLGHLYLVLDRLHCDPLIWCCLIQSRLVLKLVDAGTFRSFDDKRLFSAINVFDGGTIVGLSEIFRGDVRVFHLLSDSLLALTSSIREGWVKLEATVDIASTAALVTPLIGVIDGAASCIFIYILG